MTASIASMIRSLPPQHTPEVCSALGLAENRIGALDANKDIAEMLLCEKPTRLHQLNEGLKSTSSRRHTESFRRARCRLRIEREADQ